jgi:hypothetical protein
LDLRGVGRHPDPKPRTKSGVAQDTAGRQTTQIPNAEQMGRDTALAGRQGEGLTPPGAQPANVSGERGEAETGGAMPTTASPLPLMLAVGIGLVVLGLAWRVLNRSS